MTIGYVCIGLALIGGIGAAISAGMAVRKLNRDE